MVAADIALAPDGTVTLHVTLTVPLAICCVIMTILSCAFGVALARLAGRSLPSAPRLLLDAAVQTDVVDQDPAQAEPVVRFPAAIFMTSGGSCYHAIPDCKGFAFAKHPVTSRSRCSKCIRDA